MKKELHIALLGNPNSGKTSLFNALTGLNQQVGNFPGVTVEKKTGVHILPRSKGAFITDLPGSYSLYPRRADEWVSYAALMDHREKSGFDLYIVVTDASNLSRNLLYVTQIVDLGKPVIVALTMLDICSIRGEEIDIKSLSENLQVPVVGINPRTMMGLDTLDQTISDVSKNEHRVIRDKFLKDGVISQEVIGKIQSISPSLTSYGALHYLINYKHLHLGEKNVDLMDKIFVENNTHVTSLQAIDIQKRYALIGQLMNKIILKKKDKVIERSWSSRLDSVFLDSRWGFVIMLLVLFLMFQAVFFLAEQPMNLIESAFAFLSDWISSILPDHWVSQLIVDGVIPGLGGILVFVPQIMILFGMITFFEDTGYMARISFLTDRYMRKIGLNGKSVMPMISGFACAVPAIMSARNIENRKERLLTIMATPLMSCSARIPVYTILISLVIPKVYFLGFLSLQGLVMLGLYMLGFIIALLLSVVFHLVVNIKEKSYFILELPLYRQPRWGNIFTTMFQKAKIFVLDAGKVIMVISLILWGLSSYGPSNKRDIILAEYEQAVLREPDQRSVLEAKKNASLLEFSYAGILGKKIEPAIAPLGFDWKIGIALITSFAAREVFVGTMATLYSVGDDADEHSETLRDKMQKAVKPDGSKVYTLGTGVSLMIFYVLAMQCMSTLAVVKRETGSWKWAAFQFLYMTALAYLFSMLAYVLLS